MIGVAAPLSGPATLLGNQVAAGARAAAARTGAEQAGIEVVDDACTADGGRAAAERLVATRAKVVVGFLCREALEAAMPAFKAAGIAVVTVGVRANAVTDERARTGWPVVRLAARADAERDAAGGIIAELWREKLFAIVDDGTIYGRELAESVRAAAEAEALKPVFVDTFRPGSDNQIGLAGRLKRAGAAFAFVGGDREDVAVMARDAGKLEAGITFAGGEALRAEGDVVALETGTLMIGLPEWADQAAPEALAAIRAQGALPEGYALPAYAAVEIALEALKTPPSSGDPSQPFLGRTFATAIGPVSFDGKGDLAENPYRLFRFDGARFVPQDLP
jgi:branched-chain amino acid transport system substrate-binding protein